MTMKNCSKIKDLEKRLACLQGKYEKLTDQLENQRSYTANDEETIDYHHILEERNLMEKYMQVLSTRLFHKEKDPGGTTHKSGIVPGKIVLLENEDHKLRVKVVEKVYPEEEKQISTDSPMGKAVLGKRVGESIIVTTPKGKIHYKIAGVE